MLQGTVVENSLGDSSVLSRIHILKSWEAGSWKLHKIEAGREFALEIAKCLLDGPWYVHFWESGKDDVLVVYKERYFDIVYSDKNTWHSAVEYGKSIGIPEEQLDFIIG